MKTLIALFFTVALASATYSPVWNQCGNFSDAFTPTSVTAQKDPKNQNKTLVSACGTVHSQGEFTIFKGLEVTQNVSVIFVTDWYAYVRVVPSGSNFCLNYTHDYSLYTPDHTLLTIKAYNILGDEAGCVNMSLSYPVPGSKMAVKRLEII